jgi:5-formyltetrahydrofolate cyclo-ligase
MSFFNSSNEKADLRARMKRKRVTLQSLYPRSGTQLSARFPAELLTRPGLAISGYIPIQSEIDPTALMEKLKSRGAQLCLPVVGEDDAPLSFRAWSPGDELNIGKFDVEEPLPTAKPMTPDIVLVPLLAFDKKGRRLGYGGGFYDRTLKALRAADPHVCAVGIGYAAQQLPKVPTDGGDQGLDWVLTETGAISITGKTP